MPPTTLQLTCITNLMYISRADDLFVNHFPYSKQLLSYGELDRLGKIQTLKFIVLLTKVMLKTVAFIAGKSENQATKIFLIHFSIDNLIAKISLYALSWSKLNLDHLQSFEIIFKL